MCARARRRGARLAGALSRVAFRARRRTARYQGLDGLRVERIAEAAAVNKTTVYRRWPTREALVTAALERVAEDLSAQIPDTGALTTDRVAVALAVAALLSRPEGAALARAASTQRAAPDEAWARRLVDVLARGVRP